ncbi:rhomboid family intramembrane serine protease [Treponema bryantii]|uniref:rhomboid family intramembrane serine protease n=1 Tax=Treponema bryantii TaxID=163 RepID=UPI002B29558E|nr:hypothetical protein TRBR_23780 [Treponema bryantii]
MSKKKFKINLKVSYDAPVTLSFVIICAVLFLLNSFAIKNGSMEKILASPTTQAGVLPFIVKQPLSYIRLLLYIFGAGDGSVLITNLILIMLLGPAMEERYGSVIIGIMIFVSALFAGVLNACFCVESLQGAVPVVCMMIFLNAFMSFSKKTFPLSFAAVIILFIFLEIFTGAGAVKIIICIAGGLCGSLFAFLTSPKVKASKKTSGGLLSRAEKIAYAEEIDSQSPRNKKNKTPSYDDDETTVVGTLKF